jgi:hypothetical protein
MLAASNTLKVEWKVTNHDRICGALENSMNRMTREGWHPYKTFFVNTERGVYIIWRRFDTKQLITEEENDGTHE